MFLEKTDRRIVPRWRDFLTTCILGELDHLSGSIPNIKPAAEVPPETLAAWRENKTLWHALDLIGGAFAVGQLYDLEVLEAARFIQESEDSCPRAGRELARRIIDPGEYAYDATDVENLQREIVYKNIHTLRTRLVDEPRNSIAWVDLARLYAIVGNLVKAEHAIEISCSLSGDNRFVLRSAARFFVHSGQKDRALKLIRKSDAVAQDPWLAAAEIGVSSYANVPPHYIRIARKMLDDENLSDFSKTELASALATVELLEGKSGLAKKFFRRSLASPTENSLAQAQWASESIGELNFDFDAAQLQVPRSYEAKTLREMNSGVWAPAVNNAIKWLMDQPFSSRPAAVASYLYSVIFENYVRSEEVVKSSLVSSPNDPGLLNNLAFSLLSQGKIDDAENVLVRAGSGHQDSASITLLGTWGLLKFRRGEYDEGRTLYLRAIDRARLLSQPKYEAMGMLYLAQEEMRANLSTKVDTLARAERIARKQADLDVLYVLERVLKNNKQTQEP